MLPEFQTIMLPLLESLKEGKELAVTYLRDALAMLRADRRRVNRVVAE